MPRSYKGYYGRLSNGTKGFESPTRRQVFKEYIQQIQTTFQMVKKDVLCFI